MTVCESSNLVVNAEIDGEPMEFSEKGSDVATLPLLQYEASSTVLDVLQSLRLFRGDTVEYRVTIVKT